MVVQIPTSVKISRVLLIIIGAIPLVFMLTIGLMFFVMDVTAKFYEFLFFLVPPLILVLTGAMLFMQWKMSWILALIENIIILVLGSYYAISTFIGIGEKQIPLFTILFTLFTPVLLMIIVGLVLMYFLLKKDTRQYYFS